MIKRGIKTSGNNNKERGYFLEEQEQAVIQYLSTEDKDEKDKIFENKLKPAIFKMVESIIHVYKLYIPDEEYVDTFNDTLSFLLTKFERFIPGKYKAYSYYGTICKNYLIGKLQNHSKSAQRTQSYDITESDYINNIRYSEGYNKNAQIAKESIEKLTGKIKTMLKIPNGFKLKENEKKVGEALINLFDNWDEVLTTVGSNKLNKSAILFFLRDQTGLDTKGIRDSMKKYKKEFYTIKTKIIE